MAASAGCLSYLLVSIDRQARSGLGFVRRRQSLTSRWRGNRCALDARVRLTGENRCSRPDGFSPALLTPSTLFRGSNPPSEASGHRSDVPSLNQSGGSLASGLFRSYALRDGSYARTIVSVRCRTVAFGPRHESNGGLHVAARMGHGPCDPELSSKRMRFFPTQARKPVRSRRVDAYLAPPSSRRQGGECQMTELANKLRQG